MVLPERDDADGWGRRKMNVFVPAVSTFIFENVPLTSSELSQIKEAGFNLIEIWGNKSHLDFTDPAAIKKIKIPLTSLGIKVASYHGPFGEELDLSSQDETIRRKAVKGVTMAMEALEELGGKMLVVHASSGIKEGTERELCLAKAHRSLEELLKIAERKKKTLAVENLLAGSLGDNSEELWKMVNSFFSPSIGICLDTGHINNIGEDLIQVARKFQSRLATLHVHDNNGNTDEHLLPGEGNIRWGKFLAALAQGSYDGPFMYELIKREDNPAALGRAYAVYKKFKQIFKENLV